MKKLFYILSAFCLLSLAAIATAPTSYAQSHDHSGEEYSEEDKEYHRTHRDRGTSGYSEEDKEFHRQNSGSDSGEHDDESASDRRKRKSAEAKRFRQETKKRTSRGGVYTRY